jgi:hypothetical protein
MSVHVVEPVLVVEPFVFMFFDVATKTQVSYLLFYQRDRMLWCSSGSSLQECFFYVFVKNLKIVVFKKT